MYTYIYICICICIYICYIYIYIYTYIYLYMSIYANIVRASRKTIKYAKKREKKNNGYHEVKTHVPPRRLLHYFVWNDKSKLHS